MASLKVKRNKVFPLLVALILAILAVPASGCTPGVSVTPPLGTVPRENAWGIYKLDIMTQDVSLVYSFPADCTPSFLRLNNAGNRFIFSQKAAGQDDSASEIYTYGVNDKVLKQLTDNDYYDLYPVWSPDDEHVAFLSLRGKDLDIYTIDADGNNEMKLYDSGDNDADIDWVGDSIVFTSGFAIWMMHDDGTHAVRLTGYPEMGLWGKANLPYGDYDPRLSPDGRKIVFERMVNIEAVNGGYDLFTVERDGQNEQRLTATGYAQGIAEWSHTGNQLVYGVAAMTGRVNMISIL
jgi:Tol biopolymer transport system component